MNNCENCTVYGPLVCTRHKPTFATTSNDTGPAYVEAWAKDRRVAELEAALLRTPTVEEKQREAVSFASYRAFLAGVAWGAANGRGDWDGAERAWADWADRRVRDGSVKIEETA